MASFKEMLANKNKAVGVETLVRDNSQAVDVAVKELPSVKEEPKQEVAATQPPKPLTFAEKMALKKAETQGKTPSASTTPTPVTAQIAEPKSTSAENGIVSSLPIQTDPNEILRTGVVDPSMGKDAERLAAIANPASIKGTIEEALENTAANNSPETAQAYADISEKINSFEALADGPPLEGAMKELKEALMKNPNAVSLMLDTDYGKMVIALRRITKEAIIEATKEKASGRKPKTKALSLDDIDKVFDEL
jgi:hypothetical protein